MPVELCIEKATKRPDRYEKLLQAGSIVLGFLVLSLQNTAFADEEFGPDKSRKEAAKVYGAPENSAGSAATNTGSASSSTTLTGGTAKNDNASRVAISGNQSRPKIGLALAGGGTRGCAHIGVIRVLEKEGIPIDAISGTSIGAIVGGLYASGTALDEIEDLMCSKRLMHAYQTVPLPVRLAVVPVFFVPHLFGWRPYDGLYSGKLFAKFISRHAPAGHSEISTFKTPFSAVATNLLDGKPYAITSGDLGQAVQASSAIPFLRRPVEIGDKLFVDGGIAQNLPVDKVRALGADFVIAVDIDDDLKVLTKDDFRKIGSVPPRTINIQLSSLDAFQQEKADFVIHPDVTGIELLDSNTKDARRAIKAGEEITKKLIPDLKAKISEWSSSLATSKSAGDDNKKSE